MWRLQSYFFYEKLFWFLKYNILVFNYLRCFQIENDNRRKNLHFCSTNYRSVLRICIIASKMLKIYLKFIQSYNIIYITCEHKKRVLWKNRVSSILKIVKGSNLKKKKFLLEHVKKVSNNHNFAISIGILLGLPEFSWQKKKKMLLFMNLVTSKINVWINLSDLSGSCTEPFNLKKEMLSR